MRKLFWTVILAALISGRTAMGETVGLAKSPTPSVSAPDTSSLARELQLARQAPIGHRQPQARDLPLQNPRDLERVSEEDRAVDRKLIICRGC
jgi:hypothetical protein